MPVEELAMCGVCMDEPVDICVEEEAFDTTKRTGDLGSAEDATESLYQRRRELQRAALEE